jgi:hypothetical protein
VSGSTPVRIRFRVPLTVAPIVIGLAVGASLWGEHAQEQFFDVVAHVLAIGSVGLALQGQYFRLMTHNDRSAGGLYVMVNVIGVLVATGLGLGFSLRALAVGHSGEGDLAIVAAALSASVAAFAVQALFGTPGAEDDRGD